MELNVNVFSNYTLDAPRDQLSTALFEKTCRACLSSTCEELLCISNVKYEDISMQEIFRNCLSLQIEKDDNLPQNICKPCTRALLEIHKFKLFCKESDKSLRNMFNEEFKIKSDKRRGRSDANQTISDRNGSDLRVLVKMKERDEYKLDNLVSMTEQQFDNEENIKYSCNRCGRKFDTGSELREHQRHERHSLPRPRNYMCPQCHKLFSYSHLQQHMRTHTKEKPFHCQICQMRFSLNCNLRRHMMIHTGERPHKCDICDKGFIQARTLMEHRRVHTGETSFACSYCGLKFTRAAEHKTHLRSHLFENENFNSTIVYNNKCDICHRSFVTKGVLKTHMLIHGEKTFLCSHCGKGFVSNSGLLSHSKVHTGAKPYCCTVCGKAFSQLGSLKSHMLIHTGEKPFSCKLCPKAFTQRNHLKYHTRTHNGEKPYTCSYCGKSFALNGTLTIHVRTHTGETPYVCDVCGKGFYDSSSLKKHKKGHNNVQTTKSFNKNGHM